MQMHSTALHFFRKILKNQQCLARRDDLGEMAKNAMEFDVPSVEELIKSPLAKITAFSANIFGYSEGKSKVVGSYEWHLCRLILENSCNLLSVSMSCLIFR